MFLKSVFLKSIYDYRLIVLGWGLTLAYFSYFVATASNDLINGPNRAALIQDYTRLSQTPGWPGGRAYDLDTFGGFITYRLLGSVPLILAIFVILMGTGITRGEEERGSLDLLLSTPQSRRSIFLQKWAAMLFATTVISLFNWLGLWVGAILINTNLDIVGAALVHLNIVLSVLVFGGFAMLVSQLTLTRKAAGSWTGGLVVLSYMLDNLADSASILKPLHYISPFYYYNQSKPLSPTVGSNLFALIGLGLAAVGLMLAGLSMYERRDQNGVFRLFGLGKAKTHHQNLGRPTTIWLSNPLLFGLRAELPALLLWSIIPVLYVVIVLGLFADIRNELSAIIKSFGLLLSPTNEYLLSLPLKFTVIVACIHSVVLIAGWTGDETQGRLELLLSTPQARWQLLLARFVVTIVCSGLMVMLVGLSFWLMATITNLQVDSSKVSATIFGGWIICLTISAIGFGVAAFQPGLAVPVVGTLLVVSYMTDFLGGSLNLPDWLLKLSVFHYYSGPMIYGIDWLPLSVMTGLSVVCLSVATYWFSRRDTLKTT